MVANPQERSELPEWAIQHQQTRLGEKKWDDFSFEERACKGWLIPYLLDLESRVIGRWDWWAKATLDGKLPDGPIPQISFLHMGHASVSRMLEKCLTHYSCHSVRLPDLFEWLLWGFGQGENRARIDATVNEHWYRTFNLGLMLQFPHDYLGDMLSETKAGSTYWNNPNAFFPTPHTVVDFMTRMQLEGANREASVLDPCVGSGRFLMYASNYSVNLYGMDIDHVCVMACKINAFLYVPWLIRPAPWLARGETIEVGDALQRLAPTFEDNKEVIEEVKKKPQPQLTLWGKK